MTTYATDGGLSVSIRDDENLVVIALSGPLDVYTVHDFRRHLATQPLAEEQMVIDLAEVTLIDSSGLGALLNLRNQAHRDGSRRLGLVCPQRQVLRAFEIAGLSDGFSFGSDLPAVRAALGGPE